MRRWLWSMLLVAARAANDAFESENEPSCIELTLPAQTPAQLAAFEFPPGFRPGDRLRLADHSARRAERRGWWWRWGGRARGLRGAMRSGWGDFAEVAAGERAAWWSRTGRWRGRNGSTGRAGRGEVRAAGLGGSVPGGPGLLLGLPIPSSFLWSVADLLVGMSSSQSVARRSCWRSGSLCSSRGCRGEAS
jgi:hypothetical protein